MKSRMRRDTPNGVLYEIDAKYGMDAGGVVCKLTNGNQLPPSEPLIVFRAQDGMLLSLLEHYAQLCRNAGSPTSFMQMLYQRMADIAEWQSANNDKIKTPD